MDGICDNIIKIPKLQKNQTVEPSLTRHSTLLTVSFHSSYVIHGSYTLSLIILILLSNRLSTTCLWILLASFGTEDYIQSIYGLTPWLRSSEYLLYGGYWESLE